MDAPPFSIIQSQVDSFHLNKVVDISDKLPTKLPYLWKAWESSCWMFSGRFQVTDLREVESRNRKRCWDQQRAMTVPKKRPQLKLPMWENYQLWTLHALLLSPSNASSHWWDMAMPCPVLAVREYISRANLKTLLINSKGTFSSMALMFNICAVVKGWQQSLSSNGSVVELDRKSVV